MSSASSTSRVWLAAGAVAAVLIVAVTWLLVIGPARADTAALSNDTVAVEAQNSDLMTKLTALKEQDQNRAELEDDLRQALAGLPADVAIPSFNSQIVQQTEARNLDLRSVTVGPPTAPTQGAAATASTDPATPASGVLGIPITIQVVGTQLDELYFLRDVQQIGPRHALVGSTAFSVVSDETGEVGADGAVVAPTTSQVASYTLTTQVTVFSSSLSESDQAALADVLGDVLAD